MSETDPNPETRDAMALALRFHGVPAIGITDVARVADRLVAAAEERERDRWEAALHRAVAEADRGARIQGEQTERKRCIAIVAAVNAERRQRPISYAAAAGWQSACAEIGERLREVPSTENEMGPEHPLAHLLVTPTIDRWGVCICGGALPPMAEWIDAGRDWQHTTCAACGRQYVDEGSFIAIYDHRDDSDDLPEDDAPPPTTATPNESDPGDE